MLTIELPWPSKNLHPNSRVHWGARARSAKKARADAARLTLCTQHRSMCNFTGTRRIPVCVTFRPPDRRKRDIDGMLSACKPLLDGVADGLHVDDSLFDLSLQVGLPHENGKVIMQISGPEAAIEALK